MFSKAIDEPQDSDGELFSSQGETDTEAEDAAKHSKKARWPQLIDTVALCYVAALLMRLPVTIADMYRMAMRGDFPFIRILKSVPSEMRDKLPSTFVAILETKRLVKPEQLHTAVQDMILFYHRKFNMMFPPLNWPLILFQYIKRLALPVEIYPAVKNLKQLVDFDFNFPTKMRKRQLNRSPETQLVTLVVIATKLFFPFDDIRRHPESASEPATQVIDWTVWEQAQRHFENREAAAGHLEKGKEILTSENDVFGMTTTQMDEYMDWYENSWLISSRVPNPVADLFPTGRTGIEEQPGPSSAEEHEEESITNMLHDVTSQMIPRRPNPNSDSDIPRPGSEYKRYRCESDLPEMARPFYETVAKVAGITLHSLIRAVFTTEVKISRWQENRRRREAYGESLDMGISEGEGDEDMSDEN
ncbi:transcription initiation factor RRN7 [Aspergillus sclerotialis]|uniref:Transcription initiation factor RRN7 n=1 Tax=Aspergillus sclerotialis TaxID=2070753 RepID=A0A3A2Z6I3_9EURO|nr:transcription initiation factor RRN7 [Aspergillus sclerotialis]